MAGGVRGRHHLPRRFPGGMKRVVQPELLDELPAADPRAIQSRRDLRRINAIMGNALFIEKYLGRLPDSSPLSFAEIGAGDGHISLHIAKNLSRRGIAGRALLVDKQPTISDATMEGFKEIGWSCEVVKADVFDWLEGCEKLDVIFANLFLHHFEDKALARLLAGVANACDAFAATEPRRGKMAEFVARNVWLIGCNEVTCHDAAISVRAGFYREELSQLWPRGKWKMTEHSAGMFSHFFGATRKT